ncbi:peptide/nickel transport system ATP-binding protein [Streptosporangium becharense]|uniref:Peptide/nickel transport system ATP-binding protein n=1 Tax=Streptosporangium becharense TaxID=1816182 RepID=A0A7W9ICJ0_9ACTN|nr:ATP-binding cassette domain-containing protein [Streptosporangium becharense]MBB2912981.1 peptide/nickel transport system ATP-binding protein [Streptosporangium becharense]MBB5818194.1 peptide/nickel transport system ATP-binding protein [Streptosporangium becharense]
MLKASDVTVRYGRQTVLDRVGFTLEPGRVTGLGGPSGCGKSTLARVLALMLRPASGTVTLDGHPVRGWRQRADRELRISVALVYQQPRLAVDPRLTLTEIIAEPRAAVGRPDPERTGELAAEVGLTPDLLTRRPHEVSDGQLQRACLARALSLEPRYLICDEMTTMLDASTQAHLVAVVNAYRERTGAGVLAISHDDVLLGRWADSVTTFGRFGG